MIISIRTTSTKRPFLRKEKTAMTKTQTFPATPPQPLRRAWTTFAVIGAWLFVTFAPASLPANTSRTSKNTQALSDSAYYKHKYRQNDTTRRLYTTRTWVRSAAHKQKIRRPGFGHHRNSCQPLTRVVTSRTFPTDQNSYQPPKRGLTDRTFPTNRNKLGRLFWWNMVWRQWFLTR